MADIECRSCGTKNDAQEHRCARCGRRLHFAGAQAAPDSYPVSFSTTGAGGSAAAAAPAFESYPGGAPAAEPEHIEYQPQLFRDTPGSPKVIPIPTLTPLRPSVRERDGHSARRVSPRPGSARQSLSRPPSQVGRRTDSQQALDLQEAPAASGMVLEPGSAMHQELIFCDAPVALPTHRMLAAAVDASIIVVGLGLFLGAIYLLTVFVGGNSEMVIDRQTMPFVGTATGAFTLFYRFLWCLANGDSPGMRFAGLRLVDFDGRRPNREQRAIRAAAAILSLAAAGLGILWALVDEENLTWHDHISKTFPTPA